MEAGITEQVLRQNKTEPVRTLFLYVMANRRAKFNALDERLTFQSWPEFVVVAARGCQQHWLMGEPGCELGGSYEAEDAQHTR